MDKTCGIAILNHSAHTNSGFRISGPEMDGPFKFPICKNRFWSILRRRPKAPDVAKKMFSPKTFAVYWIKLNFIKRIKPQPMTTYADKIATDFVGSLQQETTENIGK